MSSKSQKADSNLTIWPSHTAPNRVPLPLKNLAAAKADIEWLRESLLAITKMSDAQQMAEAARVSIEGVKVK